MCWWIKDHAVSEHFVIRCRLFENEHEYSMVASIAYFRSGHWRTCCAVLFNWWFDESTLGNAQGLSSGNTRYLACAPFYYLSVWFPIRSITVVNKKSAQWILRVLISVSLYQGYWLIWYVEAWAYVLTVIELIIKLGLNLVYLLNLDGCRCC